MIKLIFLLKIILIDNISHSDNPEKVLTQKYIWTSLIFHLTHDKSVEPGDTLFKYSVTSRQKELIDCIMVSVLHESTCISFTRRRHHFRWKTVKCRPSLWMTFDQWGILSVPHMMWCGASVFSTSSEGRPIKSPLAPSQWKWLYLW